MLGKLIVGIALAFSCILPVSAANLTKDPLVQDFVTIGSMIQKYAQMPRCAGPYQFWHKCVLYTYFINTDHVRSSTIFEHGKPNGEYHSFFFSGLPLVDKYYINGVENGIRVSYSTSGHLISKVPYVKGKRNGLAYNYYGMDGHLRSEVNYKNNLRDGVTREYYRNGKISQIANYRKGELHGKFELFFQNGQKNIENYYENGQQTGAAYKYSEKGDLLLLEYYRKGLRHGVTVVYQQNKEVLISVIFDNDEPVYGKCGNFGDKTGRDLSFKELMNFANGRGFPTCYDSETGEPLELPYHLQESIERASHISSKISVAK